MRILAIPIILLGYVITISSCESTYNRDYVPHRSNSLISSATAGGTDSDLNGDTIMDKRAERYAFGLGRRAYTYTSGGSGVKRLPVYNFGLGKRARPYGFGLGKRSDDEEYGDSSAADISYDLWPLAGQQSLSEKIQHQRDIDGSEKRARPYSFGLGKRLAYIDDQVERRSASPQRYNFGLGRR